MADLSPFFAEVQAHYDLSDEFFALFLDPTRTYSCAYFRAPHLTLEQAQRAKIDLSLRKCDLRPGMTLLDIGCGWGSTMLRAADLYDVRVIGLTLSRNQFEYVRNRLAERPGRNGEVLLCGWEEFEQPVDRIVSIGAFEHFRRERYDAFFERCRDLLPRGGRMLLHTIIGFHRHQLRELGLPVTHDYLAFGKFMAEEIFPGGQLPQPQWIREHAERAGFRLLNVQSLQLHYARTLDLWAEALREHRVEAIALTSTAEYDRYRRYLTGCAELFRTGYVDVRQHVLHA
ncbi:cyclopropane mycolic acid synthase family methyltransferase [Nocardia stercoris]|uniref:Methyltransferase domain-containing protein n=1 Tax=Nocardia stercoris TaxID=2483361 RepID=A0A3M2LCZ5_9NOCA|nr:cyclopropane mycolic acid synthase family methyltransferase [Nocardia stercoris]RMI35352.1 methyltransferase domain-containing protein [Nocardia stercoris]